MRNSSGTVVPSASVSADNIGDLGYSAGFKVSEDETIAILSGDVGGLHRIVNPFDRMAKGEQLILPGKLATAFPHGMGTQNNGVYDAAITADGTRAATITGGRLYRLDSLRAAKAADVAWTHLTNFAYNADLASNNQSNDERRNRRKIAFDPANNNVLLVGAKAKLMYSDDGGANLADVAHMPAPTVGAGSSLMTYIAFDKLSAVTGGKTQRFAVGVSGSGIWVTQDGNPANLALIYNTSVNFFDLMWDEQIAGKLWIITALAHPNVRSWTVAGGVVTESKFPRQINQLLVRKTNTAHQIAIVPGGSVMHTTNDWAAHRWWQGINDTRGIGSRSPIAARRMGYPNPGWPMYCKTDGSELHMAIGLGHCFTRWDDIPATVGNTRPFQFPVIEATYQGINRLIGQSAEWLPNGKVAFLSQDVTLAVGDPEAPFTYVTSPATSLGYGYQADTAIDVPTWCAAHLQGGGGCFDADNPEALTMWTGTSFGLSGGIAVANKGQAIVIGNQNNWPIWLSNADTATPVATDAVFTGFTKTVGPTENGFGFSGNANIRQIVTCNKATGAFFCWNYKSPQYGLWFAPSFGATFTKVIDGVLPSSGLFGTWAAQLEFAPGTHDLYLTPRGGGLVFIDPTNRIRVSRNASACTGPGSVADFVDLPTLCNPAATCFGAPMPGTSYPMLWAMAHRISDQALGIFGSPDGGLTWPIYFPWQWNTTCNGIAADPVKFGRLIVSVHGFGHQFLDLSSRDNRRR